MTATIKRKTMIFATNAMTSDSSLLNTEQGAIFAETPYYRCQKRVMTRRGNGIRVDSFE